MNTHSNRSKKLTRVLVTGVGGRSFGNQILHALLLREDYHVVTTDADPFSFGLYQTPDRYIVPFANDPEYIPAVLRIVKREKLHAILPGTEAENLVLANNRGIFVALGCTIIASPDEIIRLCDDKAKINTWLEDNGFLTPRTVTVSNWRALVADVGFPVIGKPTKNTGGSRNVAILQDANEVEQFLAHVPNREEIIFQEYVGTHENEYTVGVLVAKDGEIIDSIVIHRKLIGLSLGENRVIGRTMYALSTGYSQGIIIKHDFIQQTCEQLATTLGVKGPLNIQCRLTGDKLYVFEVHPRFSGTTSIRADAGFNEPDILLRNFLGNETIGRLDYRYNVAAIRAFRSILAPMQDLANVPRA